MVKYTLLYFDGRGRGEVCRLLFALADVKYEDKRVAFEEWGETAPKMPFAALPVLQFEGETLCQSDAIEFYLAKKFGFAGCSSLDEAKILMILGCAVDTTAPVVALFGMPEDEAKDALRRKYEAEKLPKYLLMLEKLLVANKGGDGYFVGKKLSVADVKVARIFDWYQLFGINCDISKYPKLKAHNDRVMKTPRIAAHVAKRPGCQF